MTGLTAAEAARRLAEHGPNELPREEATPAWRLLARQFASPIVALLLAAAVLAWLLGEIPDTIAIAAILVLNALVGFFQEARAERAILALRALAAPRARVLRDGHASMIPAAEVGSHWQFERVGYFCVDSDSTPGSPVFNRTVTLKDSWAKIEKKGG